MLAAGYTAEELTHELLNTDFNALLDDTSSSNLFSNTFEDVRLFLEKFGWFRGEVLEQKVSHLITKKTGLKNTTFAQLYAATKKHLRITATCVTTHRLVYLDHVSHPEMPVAVAVHASSAIPFFYQPVQYKGMLYVDGGAIRNLPHDGFERSATHTTLALVLRTGKV